VKVVTLDTTEVTMLNVCGEDASARKMRVVDIEPGFVICQESRICVCDIAVALRLID
jgi:hypothetical protein